MSCYTLTLQSLFTKHQIPLNFLSIPLIFLSILSHCTKKSKCNYTMLKIDPRGLYQEENSNSSMWAQWEPESVRKSGPTPVGKNRSTLLRNI